MRNPMDPMRPDLSVSPLASSSSTSRSFMVTLGGDILYRGKDLQEAYLWAKRAGAVLLLCRQIPTDTIASDAFLLLNFLERKGESVTRSQILKLTELTADRLSSATSSLLCAEEIEVKEVSLTGRGRKSLVYSVRNGK